MNAANYVRGLSARQETLNSKIEDITEHIIFHSNLDEDEEDEIGDDDGFLCSFSAVVEKLGGNKCRTLEPVSMTPAGPWGPALDVGTVFEAEPLGDGTYHYLRNWRCSKCIATTFPVVKTLKTGKQA